MSYWSSLVSLLSPFNRGWCPRLTLLVFLLGLVSFAQAQSPTQVVVAPVVQQTVADPVEALGTLRANESVQLSVNVSETVSAIYFEDGQRVEKGELLVAMASGEEQALLEEAKYRLDEARRQLDRINLLAKRGDASQSLLDERQREFNVANAQLAAIQSQLKDRLVKAPFAGKMGLRNISPGAFLAPGDLITTLIDDRQMKLDFTVPSVFLTTLTPGMPIEARARAFGNQVFTGKVATVDNQIDPVSRSIRVRAILPNPDGLLKPGLLMEVNLLTRERSSLVIPEEALVPQGQQHFVYVVEQEGENHKVVKKAVEIGARSQGQVEAIKGLSADERVIIRGAVKVRPGALVTPTPNNQ